MAKFQLLELLDLYEQVDAHEVARVMEMSYLSTAMALLRLVRQALAARDQDPDSHVYVYELTPKGETRLDYLLEVEIDDE